MEVRRGKLNIVILYDDRSMHTNTTIEHLEAFHNYSRHRIYFVPATNSGAFAGETGDIGRVDLSLFDVAIVHYAVRLSLPDFLNEQLAEQLARFDGLKLLFIQDEYDMTETARRWMDRLRFDIVYTCVPMDKREVIYPSSRFPHTEFLSTLTGYAPDAPQLDSYIQPLEQRNIFIGYRARMLSPRYGLLAREKLLIGQEVKQRAQVAGIPVDIAVDDGNRIFGDDWYRFLGSVRATLGSESGSNVFDFDGSVQRAVDEALRRNPSASFEELYRTIVAPHDGTLVKMNQTSPRIFEAISLRTALILFEGEYSGIVKPELHYIPLKKDFSNIDEVFARLKDIDYLRRLTDRAYEDIIESGRYSYRHFIEAVDADIDTRVTRPARYDLFATPVMARSADGAVKRVAPSSDIGYCLSSAVLKGAFQREQMADGMEASLRHGVTLLIFWKLMRSPLRRLHRRLLRPEKKGMVFRLARRVFHVLPDRIRNRLLQWAG